MTKRIDKLLKVSNKLNKVSDSVTYNGNIKYHYASLETALKILEKDSLRLTNSRFLNDDSEEKMLGDDWIDLNNYKCDNYIFCVCDDGDQLSQWRGYCPNGGVSIGLCMNQIINFSVLFSNSETENISTVNCAIPVYYTSDDDIEKNEIIIGNAARAENLTISDFVPYIKNNKFYEEKESRIVFSNYDGKFDECVRFRTAENGIQIPYLEVRCGNVEKNMASIIFDMSKEHIKSFIDNRQSPTQDIYIPQCKNQKVIYEMVKSVYRELQSVAPMLYADINIFCEGHLPVSDIWVAPTYDRQRTKESLERFCKSKYWLSEVKVHTSTIPFIHPNK